MIATTDLNPFVYDAAGLLDAEAIIDYYIDDHNFARLIQSRRNVFLIGERGAGKSMALLYNSFPIQRLKAKRNNNVTPIELIGVFVPCNTTLTHKQEYRLLDNFRAAVVSEHFMALSILYEVGKTLAGAPEILEGVDQHLLFDEFSFVTGLSIPKGYSFFEALQLAADRESRETQRILNNPDSDYYANAVSFASIVVPLLRLLQRIPALVKSHFMLMIDDAQMLNEFQIRALNSWIAYREHSLFSFKVTTTKINRPPRFTGTGGSILEGHDFITIDMEKPLHYEDSDYGKFAEKVIATRLRKLGITATPDEFFPVHPQFEKDLADAEARVRQRAAERYPDGDRKRISDYVYKFRRAEYFRSRDAKANKPIYSGFSTIVYLSTGVVRNLLEPCWWMYDEVWSSLSPEERTRGVEQILPHVQSARIHERSGMAWQKLRELDNTIEGCTRETGKRVYDLFDNLATYFHARLMTHQSEPGAISFSISEQDSPAMAELESLLAIAQRAQMLYTREGPAKDDGRREIYYVPNRLLWPKRGLDPHGQYARASIRASVLLAAASGKAIPYRPDEDTIAQPELF